MEMSPAMDVELHHVKKHQYDLLVDTYKKAVKNNQTELEWLGNQYLVQFAYQIIEYLKPRFKDMK